jgi:hypothetical protein
MSRFDGAWDESGDLPGIFWEIDLQRALTSGRGQRILREIEAALLTMPEHKLIADEIVELGEWDEEVDRQIPTGAVCAVGAYAVYRATQGGKTREQALLDLAKDWGGERDCWQTEQLGRRVGLARTVAWELACVNDETFGHLTPDGRHAAVLAWVRDRIKPSEHAATS